eukprot:snap_masked-scaffold_4-processed-gene-7.56-mRNA-1 protein AED:1.00 eAED:1.00 QI:0/0/0/0/1/1/2/0/387
MFGDCALHMSLQALVTPLGMYTFAMRLLLLQAKYNHFNKSSKDKSKQNLRFRKFFREHGKLSSSLSIRNETEEQTVTVAPSEVHSLDSEEKAPFLITKKFVITSNICILILYVGIAFAYSGTVCPTFLEKRCLLVGQNLEYTLASLVYFMPAKLQKGDYTDPFEIVKETKLASTVPIFLSIVYFVCTFTDPLNVVYDPEDENQGSIVFFYGFFLDVAIAWFGFISLTVPVLKSLHFRYSPRMRSGADLSLDDILANKHGRQAFKKHLINEFSSENLHFYETILLWKKKYAKFSSNSILRQGKNIYNRWLAPSAPAQVNISYKVRERIKQDLENGEIEDSSFDDALLEVKTLMDFDSFPRFRRTRLFKDFIVQHGFDSATGTFADVLL